MHDAGRALMDAEEEDEKAWLTQYASDALDEFDDVSWEEKELMKMWNAFTRSYSIWSDAYVARGCTIFAVRHARELAAKKLRQNFLLHLVCLGREASSLESISSSALLQSTRSPLECSPPIPLQPDARLYQRAGYARGVRVCSRVSAACGGWPMC